MSILETRSEMMYRLAREGGRTSEERYALRQAAIMFREHDPDRQDAEQKQPSGPPDFYHLVAGWETQNAGTICTAACMTCIASGRIVAGMGGPGYVLAPEIVKALDSRQNGGKARVVVDAEEWDRLQVSK